MTKERKPPMETATILSQVSIIICLLLTGLVRPVFSQFRPFTELWNNLAYYDTNIERKGFASLLGRFEGKAGIYLFETPLQVYGAYYGVSSQSNDYWDNAIYSGAGLRFKPFEEYQGSSWQDEWIRDIKVFGESLYSSFLKDQVSGEVNKRIDTRYGLDLWHEWNLDKPDESQPWGELWANLSYRETNFGWESFKNYVFYFQPKVGKHLGRGIEAYLRADVVLSGKGGSSYSFLNNAAYGIGIRFEPWRKIEEAHELLRKFKMFVEILEVSYLKDKPTEANKTVNSDVRFGIDFSYGRVY